MQKILLYDNLSEIEDRLEGSVYRLLCANHHESFIGIDSYDLISFDWLYEKQNKNSRKVTIYLDNDDLFLFCETPKDQREVEKIIKDETLSEPLDNEHMLFHFFMRMLKNDLKFLDDYEEKLTDAEDNIINGIDSNSLYEITAYRKTIIKLKRYYQQLSLIFDNITANENQLLTEKGVHLCNIIGGRIDRLFSDTVELRDFVAQVLSIYQSQLDYKQNNLMKVFTVVTVIFLPLTLLVGWYGMNFNMPEFSWEFGYATVIAVSVAIVVVLLFIFKHKKWI